MDVGCSLCVVCLMTFEVLRRCVLMREEYDFRTIFGRSTSKIVMFETKLNQFDVFDL